jgi:sterol desaturase/sphingolipid hydroxylase (fatty acid hydroxylase superfamily)
MNLSERVKGILLSPKQEWQTISKETTVIPELYKTYVVILAAIGPVASIIGMSLVGISIPFAGSFRVSIFTSISSAIVHYILTLIGVYVLALIIDALAPTFSGQKSLNQAFKVAAYSYTPGWVVGVVGIIPSLSPLMILGLYGLYLLYLGLPVLMESPQEKSLGYTITVIIAAIVIFMVIGVISRAFISYPTPGMPIPR